MSIAFNGTTDNVNQVEGVIPTGPGSDYVRNQSLITFACWIQVETELTANAQIFYVQNECAGANPNNSRLEIQLGGPGANLRKVVAIIRAPDTGGACTAISVGVIPVRTAFQHPIEHIVVTFNLVTQEIGIYINGLLDSTTGIACAASTDNTKSGSTFIGYDGAAVGQWFPGKMSDLRLYKDWIADARAVLSMYRMNGHDGLVGDSRKSLQLRNQFDFNSGGTNVTTGNCYDSSAAQVTGGLPFAVAGPPVWRDWKEAYRRIVP